MLTYANDAKPYVLVSSLHLISRRAVWRGRVRRCINPGATPPPARPAESGGKARYAAAVNWPDTSAQRAAKRFCLATIVSSISYSAIAPPA